MEQQGLYLPEFEHDNCGAGFICSLKGERTHDIIGKALEILEKLEHRGAVSADGKTGDGAGILIEIPDQYFRKVCDFELPAEREYAVGMTFLPQKENQRQYCIDIFEKHLKEQQINILGWRTVPVDNDVVGRIASETLPFVQQLFVAKGELSEREFQVKLYIARKKAEHEILKSKLSQKSYFYLPSFSTTTIIYKGLLIPEDISLFYKDLREEEVVTK